MAHNGSPKLVVLLHGWLGRPGTFGRLPKMLAERGHAVLPLFHKFDSFSRGVTIEELAGRLEAALDRERRDQPTVLIAHSMGGLVAMVWMLRYHAEKGHRPPIERLVTFGTPRHGVCLRPFARAFVKWGFVPGTALARQMQAPNPFLWDLAWSELKHAALLPPMVIGAGLLHRANPVSALVGGRESDGVVPAVCTQPNAVFVTAAGRTQILPLRPFHIFQGRAHTGPRGLYAGLKAPEDDPRTALLLAAVEGRSGTMIDRGGGAAGSVRQALFVVRHRPQARLELIQETPSGDSSRVPLSAHGENLSLALLKVTTAGATISISGPRADTLERQSADSPTVLKVSGGQVTYIDF